MNETNRYPWRLFWLLLGGGMIGVAAVLPYVLALFGDKLAATHVPLALGLILQFLQIGLLLGVAIGIGLLVSRKIGLGAPLLENWIYGEKAAIPRGMFRLSVISGAAVGGIIVALISFVFVPLIPQLLAASEAKVSLWKRLLACFYGGLDEEVFMRLFLLSVLLWLLTKIWANGKNRPASGAFWTVNIVVAIVFGIGHLPAVTRIMPITPTTIAYVLSLNGIAALVFGYLYWKRGLESAILAHFSADIVLHIIGPIIIKGPGS